MRRYAQSNVKKKKIFARQAKLLDMGEIFLYTV